METFYEPTEQDLRDYAQDCKEEKTMNVNAPRCYNHKDRETFPKACHTCQRIAIEQEMVTKVVDAFLAAGYSLQTDLQEDPRPEEPTSDRVIILAELMETDDEFMGVFKNGERHGWVRFVYGNDGYDVVSDYTTNLEEIMKPINEYADSLC